MLQKIVLCSQFRVFAEDNVVYVDKTGYLHKLVTSEKRFFTIARPKGFGKSTLCDTLYRIFNGDQMLFDGLAISRTDYDFKKYPVIYLDFCSLGHTDIFDFRQMFRMDLIAEGRRNKVMLAEDTPAEMLRNLIEALSEAVVIIKNYDDPLVYAAREGRREMVAGIKEEFRAFYRVLREMAENLRFVFISGLTRFEGQDLFSEIDILNDLTFDPEYAAMLGYTEGEVVDNFWEQIDAKLLPDRYNDWHRRKFVENLKTYYGGFRFSPYSNEEVFDPLSLARYFSDQSDCFPNYWALRNYNSTRIAVSLARRSGKALIGNGPCTLDLTYFSRFDISRIAEPTVVSETTIPMLCYMGYLTFAGIEKNTVELTFPNDEVGSNFLDILTGYYLYDVHRRVEMSRRLVEAAKEGNFHSVIHLSNYFFQGMGFSDAEPFKEEMISIIFRNSFLDGGMPLLTGKPYSYGVLDNLVLTDEHKYVFEFRIDGKVYGQTLDEQMKNTKYSSVFYCGRNIHLIKIDFDLGIRKIVRFTHQTYRRNDKTETVYINPEADQFELI